MPRFLPAGILLTTLLTALPVTASVKLSQDRRRVLLANDQVEVSIRPDNGTFSLSYQKSPVITQGYWSQVGRRRDGKDIARVGKPAAPVFTIDPASNQGQRGEVAITFAPGGAEGGLPCEVEMRYTLAADSTTLYVTSVWRHGPGMAGFSLAEGRHVMKLNSTLFDYLAIDEKRHSLMPSGSDWDNASPLNLKEARRITTGPFAGKAEHKYGYSGLIAQLPSYGWASSKKQLGAWLINPSAEYLAGGPTKMELTGHLDVNREGTPVLLNMWHGSHYGGSALNIAQDEVWSKVIGPFAIHLNSGATPEALWQQSKTQAKTEQAAWPYPWLKLSEYLPAASRSTVTGQLKIEGALTKPDTVWIGLAAPAQEIQRRGRKEVIDWQCNSRDYQVWRKVPAGQSFSLPHVRPGPYTLYAFADGIPGEFSHPGITVTSGQALDLSTLTWKPEAGRRTLWQIGTADRSAVEFRRGNEAGTWGLYYQFATDFPQGVNYTIGKSDPAKDWNYAHCGISSEGQRGVKPASWNIHFQLDSVPTTSITLRLGIAGNRSPEGVRLAVNNKPAGGTGPMPDTAVMHRDAVRGAWFERSLPIPANLLQPGSNTITLTVPANSWPDGVLYDFVRLEAVE